MWSPLKRRKRIPETKGQREKRSVKVVIDSRKKGVKGKMVENEKRSKYHTDCMEHHYIDQFIESSTSRKFQLVCFCKTVE